MTGPRKFPTIEEWEEIKKKKREYSRNYDKKRYTENPIARRKTFVRAVTNRAIRSGKLIRLPCENCGDKNAEAHHCNYKKPLEVMWLCKKCHNDWHKNNTPIY